MAFISLSVAAERADMHPASLRRVVRELAAAGVMVEGQHYRHGPRRAYEIDENWLAGWLASKHRAPR